MYENKFPTGYLNNEKPSVIQSGETYVVDYGMGTCHYVLTRVGNRIKQEVLIMTHCDMSGVIDEINKKSPLNEGDLNKVNMEIREHSLHQVEMFIRGRGHHQ